MDAGSGFMVFTWTCVVIQFSLVVNRLYVRFARLRLHDRGERTWLWSDFLVTLAWLLIVAMNIDNTLMYKRGVMRPDLENVSIEDLTFVYKTYWAGTMFYWMPFYCIKLSIILFYLELVPPNLRRMRIAIYGCLAMVVIGILLTELTLLLMCRPLNLVWDVDSGYGTDACKNSRVATIPVAWHIATDIYVYIIPLFLIKKLSISSRSQRLTAFFIFASGILCVAAAIPSFLSYLVPALYNPYMWMFYVGCAEEMTAIFVACLPALRVSLVRLYTMYARWKGGEKMLSSLVELERDVVTTNQLRSQLQDSDFKGRNRDEEYGGDSTDSVSDNGAVVQVQHEKPVSTTRDLRSQLEKTAPISIGTQT